MSQPIPIIGAGIAGLTLARCLIHRGIPCTLYEKASSKSRHNYAITLHASAYRPLIKFLKIGEFEFKERVAVDAGVGGRGRVGSHVHLSSHDGMYDTASSFRANRRQLESFLSGGLDVRRGHELRHMEWTCQGPELQFGNGGEDAATQFVNAKIGPVDFVVGADGPHSILREKLLPVARLQVLPYVAFRGKIKLDGKTFEHVYEPAMQDSNAIEFKHEDVVLGISVDQRTTEYVNITWTFSRPARGASDALHRPDRSASEARIIPEEFFHQVRALEDLPQPFLETFKEENLRKNKGPMHWLMRKTLLAPLPNLQDVLTKERVCLIGDAAHAEPIIGGNGANAAIIDGVNLARSIAHSGFNAITSRYNVLHPYWERAAMESEKSIARIHNQSMETETP